MIVHQWCQYTTQQQSTAHHPVQFSGKMSIFAALHSSIFFEHYYCTSPLSINLALIKHLLSHLPYYRHDWPFPLPYRISQHLFNLLCEQIHWPIHLYKTNDSNLHRETQLLMLYISNYFYSFPASSCLQNNTENIISSTIMTSPD